MLTLCLPCGGQTYTEVRGPSNFCSRECELVNAGLLLRNLTLCHERLNQETTAVTPAATAPTKIQTAQSGDVPAPTKVKDSEILANVITEKDPDQVQSTSQPPPPLFLSLQSFRFLTIFLYAPSFRCRPCCIPVLSVFHRPGPVKQRTLLTAQVAADTARGLVSCLANEAKASSAQASKGSQRPDSGSVEGFRPKAVPAPPASCHPYLLLSSLDPLPPISTTVESAGLEGRGIWKGWWRAGEHEGPR